MPHTSVTALYAALLALLFLFLSVRVIGRRRAAGIAIGAAGAPQLERAACVHANFAEYTPLALLLMLLVEGQGAPAWRIHALGLALLIGRLTHAFGVSRSPENIRFRVFGMGLTLTVIGFGTGLLLTHAIWP